MRRYHPVSLLAIASRTILLSFVVTVGCSSNKATTKPFNATVSDPASGNTFDPTPLITLGNALKSAINGKGNPADTQIGLVPNVPGTVAGNNFWTDIQIGSNQAKIDLGVEAVNFQLPSETTDPTAQIGIIQNFVKAGYKGIGFSAVSTGGSLITEAYNAVTAGTQIVTIDSDINAGRAFYIGTDSFQAGYDLGTAVVASLGGTAPGGVIILGGGASAGNAHLRRNGFCKAINDTFPGACNANINSAYASMTDVNLASAVSTFTDATDPNGSFWPTSSSDASKNNTKDLATEELNKAFAVNPAANVVATCWGGYEDPAVAAYVQANPTKSLKIAFSDAGPNGFADLIPNAPGNDLNGGTIVAMSLQRGYWEGYIATYVLTALSVLGVEATTAIVNTVPYDQATSSPGYDATTASIFSGHDTVTPATIEAYQQYLSALGVASE